jgi:tetratricopeptide (TPR) repeat protein
MAMRRPILVLVLLFPLACAPETPEPDHQKEWRSVLERKKAAGNDASAATRQAYADSLAAFVRKHPNHSRAREVYHRVQLEFAEELMALGRHQDAIRFYRSVLTHDASNSEAHRGLTEAAERLAISMEKLEQLEKGMSHRDVAGILGKPIPGWTVKTRHRGLTVEAWYYRTTTGGIAGVYFRDGEVFAAESNSDAPLGL